MKKFLKRFLLIFGILVIIVVAYFFIIRKLDNDLIGGKAIINSDYDMSQPVLLPSSFINGERFYIKLKTTNDDTLLGYCDTGGGISMVLPAVTDKLHLESQIKTALVGGFMPIKYIPFEDIVTDKRIPPPVLLRHMILRRFFQSVSAPYLMIPPMDDEMKFISKSMPFDVFFAQNFFMGKAWTIDYPKRQVWVNTPVGHGEIGQPGVLKLGFKKNTIGEPIFGHPSLQIEIDGEVIDVLFDTGATIILSEQGKKELNTPEKTIGGSFIAESIFEKWRAAHPHWKYYAKADMNKDVIEVPKVKIGGIEVGPVLFAKRPDEVWSQGMISSMDKVVKGAVGGSALQYLKVTIDYNSELVKFEHSKI